jgi:DNA-binding MarR family transcriptional regulator
MQLQILLSKWIPMNASATMRRVSTPQTAADPVAAWRELNAAHAAVQAALEHALRREHGLSTIEYEVLSELGTCEKGKFRMQELADAVHTTQSTVSRVIARLEEEGLAERAMCADDRRGIFALVTDAGRERVTEATPTYRRVIGDTLGTR